MESLEASHRSPILIGDDASGGVDLSQTADPRFLVTHAKRLR